jgi:ATP-dependent DNA ligase
MIFPTLYKRTSTGAIQEWTIEVRGSTFVTRSGQVNGAIKESKPTRCKAMNEGRANATTPEQQAIVEAQAKFDKQLKSKYFKSIEEVDDNAFISPTLAHLLKNRKKPLVFPAGIQIKYNGVCCIIDKEFGSRSRKGEIFYNIRHINLELVKFFEENPDIVLHGELFNYDLRRNLNRLINLVAVTRKDKDITPELILDSEAVVRYYVYDGYVKGKQYLPYHERIKYIQDRLVGLKYVFPAPTEIIHTEDEIQTHFNAALEEGQEGVIVRMLDMPYVNKRTADIIKFKETEDAEFKILGFIEGNGTWTGCAKKAECLLPDGRTFNSNIRGTMEFLAEVLRNPHPYIGKFTTVDFQCYSEYGIPQIPYTTLIIRDYE